LTIFLISTTLFRYFENQVREDAAKLTYLRSAYWAIVTLSTVGYGDEAPETDGGVVIAVFLIVIGLSIYVSVVSRFGSFIIGRSLKEAKGLTECKYENHVVVLGMNDVAEEAIRQLAHANREVAIVVESSEEVDRASRIGAFPVLGDPTQPDSLEMANLGEASTVIINLEDDSRTILAALACRKVSRNTRVVASIRQRELIELVRESGVESVISPEALTGRMLASAVFEPNVIDLVDDITSGVEGADLREFPVKGTPLAGSTVGESLISLRRRTGVLLVGLVKEGRKPSQIANPADEERMEGDDRVILLGLEEQFKEVSRFLRG
jgi:voltage-gated potassium channel